VSLKLAKALGGEIKVESEVNKGSTFTIFLPNPPPASAPVESPQQEESDIQRLRSDLPQVNLLESYNLSSVNYKKINFKQRLSSELPHKIHQNNQDR